MSYAPVLLSDSQVIAAGAVANCSTRRLTHPFRAPYWLDSISWIIRSPPVANTGLVAFQMGGSIRCKLQMGALGLTRFFVPVWNFGPLLDQRLDIASNGGSYGTEASVGAAMETGSKLCAYSHYLWKLPKPLLVPPGSCVVPQFSRTADGFTGSATVDVALAGRELSPSEHVPDRIDVPYVSCFVGAEGTASQISNSQDLENECEGPLLVQRLIGRIQDRTANAVLKDATNVSLKTTARTVKLKMKKLDGERDLTSAYLPWSAVFDWQRRACNLNRVLERTERIVIFTAGIGATETPMVSMVGTREERTP